MYCINFNKKKRIIFIISLLIFIIPISVYASYLYNYNSCSDNFIFSVNNDSNDFTIVTDLQDKFNNIYKRDEKTVFLTFDDGPTKTATIKILDILKEYNIKANFFVVGYRVSQFPDIIKREYEEGHFIANHGYSHKNSLLYKNKDSFINEILKTDEEISKCIKVNNYHSHVFRFPNGSKGSNYSSIKSKCKQYLKEIGYCYIDWNALNSDSVKKYSSSQLLANLKKSCKNKNLLVILMHDTNDVSKSYTALSDSIKYLKSEGYTFKTFDTLLN